MNNADLQRLKLLLNRQNFSSHIEIDDVRNEVRKLVIKLATARSLPRSLYYAIKGRYPTALSFGMPVVKKMFEYEERVKRWGNVLQPTPV
jgi:hypothetical protein